MLVAYLLSWITSVGLALVGCTLPALLLGVVLIVIIFRWELVRLLRIFGPHPQLPSATGG